MADHNSDWLDRNVTGRSLDFARVSQRALDSKEWNNISLGELPQQAPTLPRHMLASASLSLAHEHHSSIATLVLSRHFASASALLRPLLEAIVASGWSIYSAKPDHVVDILFGRSDFPEIRSMMTRLDRVPELRGVLDLAEIDRHIKWFHGFTHGGMQQLGRRYSGDIHTSTFDTREIEGILFLSDWLWCYGLTTSLLITQSKTLPERLVNRTTALISEIRPHLPDLANQWPGWRPLPEASIDPGMAPPEPR